MDDDEWINLFLHLWAKLSTIFFVSLVMFATGFKHKTYKTYLCICGGWSIKDGVMDGPLISLYIVSWCSSAGYFLGNNRSYKLTAWVFFLQFFHQRAFKHSCMGPFVLSIFVVPSQNELGKRYSILQRPYSTFLKLICIRLLSFLSVVFNRKLLQWEK